MESAQPIQRVELDLDGDGEPAVPLVFPVGRGFDGRYVRGLRFKPTVTGTWPLVVRAWNTQNEMGEVRCVGVTVQG